MLLLRSIFFALLLPGSVTVLIPYLLISSRAESGFAPQEPFHYLGLPLIAIGASGLLWCIWDFFSTGRGTLAFVDPPKYLVVRGLYRYVRNPMYVSAMTIMIGEAIFFRSVAVLAEAGIFFVGAHLFVTLYEEPVLRRMFGAAYERYTQAVGRWVPRLPGPMSGG
jgi:protein-S-isoprenylcysteine O-methyltransferase Ste14